MELSNYDLKMFEAAKLEAEKVTTGHLNLVV